MLNPTSSDNEVIPTYEFGKNWSEFIDARFTDERVGISQQHLLEFLQRDDLRESTFFDVGCGSGIHSLAAYRSGASRIISFDVDPLSVSTTKALWQREGAPTNWTVTEGSALDAQFLSTLGRADIVYSWGVLHHTGDMWQAVRNVATLVEPKGVFYVALYTTSPRTPYWIDIKKRYNLAGRWGRRWLECKYLVRHQFVPDLVRRRNTVRFIREKKLTRGMDFMTDVRDWLGGYPYEDCSPDQFVDFSFQQLDMGLRRIKTGEACTEYLLYPLP